MRTPTARSRTWSSARSSIRHDAAVTDAHQEFQQTDDPTLGLGSTRPGGFPDFGFTPEAVTAAAKESIAAARG